MRKILLAIAMLGLIGCAHNASFTENAFDTIQITTDTVNEFMEYAGKVHCNGRITDEQANKLISAYAQYAIAANLADEALAVYKESQTAENQLAYLDALSTLFKHKDIIIGISQAMIGGE